MRTDLAHARESACLWMLNRWPNDQPDFNRDEMIEAFVEGYGTRLTKDVLDGDELALTATVLDAASRGEAFTKSDAARAARAMLVARDRFGAIEDEQALERATGQRQLDDATALMTEARDLFRVYEAHHRDKVERFPGRPDVPDDVAAFKVLRRKVETNALMAARLDAWLEGEPIYPTTVDRATHPAFHEGGLVDPEAVPFVLVDDYCVNPANALRDVATQMVDGETIKGVDHASFDQAEEYLAQPVEVPPLVAAMTASIDEISSLPVARHVPNRVDVMFVDDTDDPDNHPTPADAIAHGKTPRILVADEPDARAALVQARNWLISAEGLIMDASAFIRDLTGALPGSEAELICQRLDAWLTPMASPPPADEGGCKDALRSSRTEPERTDSVAEPAAFRLNTPDPRFDPAKPVTVNGFLYLPTKEK